mgnify:CR=1 FL=1
MRKIIYQRQERILDLSITSWPNSHHRCLLRNKLVFILGTSLDHRIELENLQNIISDISSLQTTEFYFIQSGRLNFPTASSFHMDQVYHYYQYPCFIHFNNLFLISCSQAIVYKVNKMRTTLCVHNS